MYNPHQSRVKTVTITIPSLHRPDLTARCLEFIRRQTFPADDWEVVVVENEAQADSILPDPLPPNVRRIELPTNEGTTGSINRAAAATQSRYILLLNNDVELQPDYIAKLVQALDGDPKLAFATGKLLRAKERTHLDGAGDAMLMAGAAYRLGHFDRDEGQYQQPMAVLSGCGAAVLYRREAFEACGQLDPDFLAYLDDFDLALRAHLLGYGGLYVPDALAYHIGSATLGDVLHARIVEYVTRNQIYLLVKDYPGSVFWRLLLRIIVYQGLWFGFVLRNGHLGAYLRGWLAGLHDIGRMRSKNRKLMAKRRITYDEFLTLLRQSERQIYDWQQSQPQERRSGLLKVYFWVFGKP